MALAMQPPVGVPAKGGPWMAALVTRPEGAKVIVRVAVPEGSPSLRHAAASEAAALSAAIAAERSKSVPGSAGSGLGADATGFSTTAGFSSAASAFGASVAAGFAASALFTLGPLLGVVTAAFAVAAALGAALPGGVVSALGAGLTWVATAAGMATATSRLVGTVFSAMAGV